jgi:pyruvate formate lyase activating enzyme
MTKECPKEAAGMLDAANVDLKSFSDEYYRNTCGSRLGPVLEAIECMKRLGIWVEVTTLIVPGMNDSEKELGQIASFLAVLDKDMPWHISKFYPMYKLDKLQPTPLATLMAASDIGKAAGLRYVYLGNAPGQGEDTFCPGCGDVLIGRVGYYVANNKIKEGQCPKCKAKIEGIWG